jgi:peptide deformylase
MAYDIVLWPDPVLLAGTEAITEIDDELRVVVGAMRRVLFEQHGVGLAAPQVGVARRIMLVCPTGVPGDDTVVINPEIVSASGSEVGEEGCLSFPGIYGQVPRARTIRVRYSDLDLRPREMELSGFVARIFLHEMDHLDGEVFIDKMLPASRENVAHLLDEQRQQYVESPR